VPSSLATFFGASKRKWLAYRRKAAIPIAMSGYLDSAYYAKLIRPITVFNIKEIVNAVLGENN
jgi:hypothetical protein